jgi:hypothetical protein
MAHVDKTAENRLFFTLSEATPGLCVCEAYNFQALVNSFKARIPVNNLARCVSAHEPLSAGPSSSGRGRSGEALERQLHRRGEHPGRVEVRSAKLTPG